MYIYRARRGCAQCPPPDHKKEWFRFLNIVFDITKAREMVEAEGADVGNVTPAQLEQYGIHREPPDPRESFLEMSYATVIEGHLLHIPESALSKPLLFAPVPLADELQDLLIDGAHTATIKVRRGEPLIAAVKLSVEQARACCVRGWPGAVRGRAKGVGR